MSVSNPTNLEEYSSFAQTVIEKHPQMDESDTKYRLINELISVLGWDRIDDVETEHPVQIGSNKKRVDYCLSANDKPSIFIEVKRCNSKISKDNREQLKSYIKQKNVDWGLLTNGKKYEILHRYVNDEGVIVKSISTISANKIEKRQKTLKILSKKSINKGKSKDIADKIQEINKKKEILKEKKNKLSENISQMISDEVGDFIEQDHLKIEEHTKEFINSIIDDIGTGKSDKTIGDETQSDVEVKPKPNESHSELKIDQSLREMVIEWDWPGGKLKPGNDKTKNVVGVINYMYNGYNFTEALKQRAAKAREQDPNRGDQYHYTVRASCTKKSDGVTNSKEEFKNEVKKLFDRHNKSRDNTE